MVVGVYGHEVSADLVLGTADETVHLHLTSGGEGIYIIDV